jgi:hypothetical protein
MSKIKLALWAIVLIQIAGLAGPVWLSVFCVIGLCFATPAAIAGMILLPGDPKNRVWDVKMERTPEDIYNWRWCLLADGEEVVKRQGSYYKSTAEGRADTRIGCLFSAAEERRLFLKLEAQKRKAEFGTTTWSLSGRKRERKTHIHVPAAAETPGRRFEAPPEGPATESQQKRSGPLARYFRAIERLIHKS